MLPAHSAFRSILRPLFRGSVLAAVLCLLTACGAPPLKTYDLAALQKSSHLVSARGAVVVREPEGLPLYDTERMIVRTSAGTLTVLGGAQWPERVPKLLQIRLSQSLENATRKGTVQPVGGRVIPQYRISSELRRFEVDEGAGAAICEIRVILINDLSGKEISERVFLGSAPIAEISASSAPIALELAAQQVFADVIAWLGGKR